MHGISDPWIDSPPKSPKSAVLQSPPSKASHFLISHTHTHAQLVKPVMPEITHFKYRSTRFVVLCRTKEKQSIDRTRFCASLLVFETVPAFWIRSRSVCHAAPPRYCYDAV